MRLQRTAESAARTLKTPTNAPQLENARSDRSVPGRPDRCSQVDATSSESASACRRFKPALVREQLRHSDPRITLGILCACGWKLAARCRKKAALQGVRSTRRKPHQLMLKGSLWLNPAVGRYDRVALVGAVGIEIASPTSKTHRMKALPPALQANC